MPTTTEDILAQARKLGDMIADHPTVKQLEDAAKAFSDDTAAQRAITDYTRHMESIAQKQQAGKPIEVEDKRKIESLQKAVATHPLLAKLQMAEMDYTDLMTRVSQAIEPDVAETPTPTPTPGNPLV